MTRKQAMQEALRDYGIRYVRGEAVYSEEEAIRFYRELGKDSVVVKPIRGAGSTGVYLCCGEEEMLDAVHQHFTEALNNGFSKPCVLVQERIYGTEYVVNTVSCEGMHRISSVGMYEKHRLSNGSNAYSYFRYISKLGVGHSRLLNYACEVADAIGIKYGPVHGEYMVDENGPVLIEVNCRPMGGGLDRKYSELVVGHHETDVALDAYLDREIFLRDSRKPYRLHR
jgi:biotin carboxylase